MRDRQFGPKIPRVRRLKIDQASTRISYPTSGRAIVLLSRMNNGGSFCGTAHQHLNERLIQITKKVRSSNFQLARKMLVSIFHEFFQQHHLVIPGQGEIYPS